METWRWPKNRSRCLSFFCRSDGGLGCGPTAGTARPVEQLDGRRYPECAGQDLSEFSAASAPGRGKLGKQKKQNFFFVIFNPLPLSWNANPSGTGSNRRCTVWRRVWPPAKSTCPMPGLWTPPASTWTVILPSLYLVLLLLLLLFGRPSLASDLTVQYTSVVWTGFFQVTDLLVCFVFCLFVCFFTEFYVWLLQSMTGGPSRWFDSWPTGPRRSAGRSTCAGRRWTLWASTLVLCWFVFFCYPVKPNKNPVKTQ